MSIGERIKLVRQTLKLTQTEFADKLGLGQSTLAQIENGKRNPKESYISLISYTFKIGIIWLKTGTGSMQSNELEAILSELSREAKLDALDSRLITEYARLPISSRNIIKDYLKNSFIEPISYPSDRQPTAAIEECFEPQLTRVKVFNQPAAAGLGNYLYENGDDDYEIIYMESSDIPTSTDCGIRISGNSMEPDIQDGSIVFVKTMPEIENGQVGIFILDGEALCKELFINHSKRRVELVSWNKSYKNKIVYPDDQFYTVGRVLF